MRSSSASILALLVGAALGCGADQEREGGNDLSHEEQAGDPRLGPRESETPFVPEELGPCDGTFDEPGEPPVPGPSALFSRTCAGCHGARGEGSATAVSLRDAIDWATFERAARRGVLAEGLGHHGARRMPGFAPKRYASATLRRDFAWLQGRAWSAPEGCVSAPVADSSPDRAAGLRAWRAPDQDNAACASCHGPDPIDLASIAYTDGDILRRAMLHLGQREAWAIVDLVGSMRSQLGRPPRDPLTFRPLQPGGLVLEPAPGLPEARNDRERVDHAFGLALAKAAPTLAGPPIASSEAAWAALEELMAIDPRSFPIGFELNRWTEDAHRGPTHRTMSDWIPDLAPQPAPGLKARALEDAYLKAPSWATLYPLLDALEEQGAERHDARAMMRRKKQSVLIVQHIMRTQIEPAAALKGPVPLPDRNAIWLVGDLGRIQSGPETSESRCPEGKACAGYPARIWEEDVRAGVSFDDELDALRLPWFWAGWMIDLSTLATHSSNSTKSTEYLTEDLYKRHLYNHATFLRFRKNLAATIEGGGWSAAEYGLERPILASERHNWGYFLAYGRGTGEKTPRDPEARALYQRLLANAFRAYWIAMRDEIERSGLAVGIIDRADPSETAADFGLRGSALAGAHFFEDLHGLKEGAFALASAPGPVWSEQALADLEAWRALSGALADPGLCDATPPRYGTKTYQGWCGAEGR